MRHARPLPSRGRLAVAWALLALTSGPAMAEADPLAGVRALLGYAGAPESYHCRDGAGGRVALGQTACLSLNERPWTGRCEMMLNNPNWRLLGAGCGSAPESAPDGEGGLEPGAPALEPGAVDAQVVDPEAQP